MRRVITTRRQFLKSAGLGAAALASPSWLSVSDTRRNRRPPNIVIIFTDDQGYGDVGVHGAKGFQTPNMDRLAREGMRFTDFYVAQPVCSASRAALLTGCYPNRIGISGALGPRSQIGISDADGLRSVDLRLSYRADLLSVTAATPAPGLPGDQPVCSGISPNPDAVPALMAGLSGLLEEVELQVVPVDGPAHH